ATQERPVEGDPLWVDNPDVAEVLNLATGVTLSHREVIGTDYAAVLALRTALQAGIHNGSPHYVCSLCGTAVYLVSQAAQRRFFFRHRPGAGGECAMLYGRLSQAEIDARKYNGVKESAAHRRMKEWLAQCLEAD